MTDYIAEVNVAPVPPELFVELVQVAIEALSGKRRAFPLTEELCLEDAPPGSLRLSDNPTNRDLPESSRRVHWVP
jgi:hypothetical protein